MHFFPRGCWGGKWGGQFTVQLYHPDSTWPIYKQRHLSPCRGEVSSGLREDALTPFASQEARARLRYAINTLSLVFRTNYKFFQQVHFCLFAK